MRTPRSRAELGSQFRNSRIRVLSAILLIGLIVFNAYRLGGKDRFFEVLPSILLPFGTLAALIWGIFLLQRALKRLALARGWTTQEEIERSSEASSRTQKRLGKAALAMFLWGMVMPLFLMWWFTNTVPGSPMLAKLDMDRVRNAYPLMVISELASFVITLRLGLRWVRSKLGTWLHALSTLATLLFFLSAFLFARQEPNVILVMWAVTVTLFPSVYLFALYQFAFRRQAREEVDREGSPIP